MKYILFVICLSANLLTHSQESINSYKYILVPEQFHFLSSSDKYQLNSLTKFLFNKYGYTAFLANEDFPEDLKSNRCLALTAYVSEVKGGFLKTKMRIDLKDCNNKIIMSSRVGETRVKEYAKAYNLAIRDAFETFQFNDYKYEPKTNNLADKNIEIDTVDDVSKAKIQKLEREIEALKEESKEKEVDNKEDLNNEIGTPKETIESTLPKEQDVMQKESTNVLEEDVSKNWFKGLPKYTRKDGIFYLKPGFGGSYLVDSANKEILKLQYTSNSLVFIVTFESHTGVGFMDKNSKDIKIEYYLDNGDKEVLYFDNAQ